MEPDRQLGLLWGGVAALLVVLSPFAERLAAVLPPCPVHQLIGVPCLTCGTTRAGIALANLDLTAALAINPLASCGWFGLVVGGIVAGLLALCRVPVREPDWRLSLPTRCLLVAVMIANWAYLVGAGV